jgi:hypothetical protein
LPEEANVAGADRGSADIFTLVMLGHPDVRLYDASLIEWAPDPTLPMETIESGVERRPQWWWWWSWNWSAPTKLPLKANSTVGGDWLESVAAPTVPVPVAPAKLPVEFVPSTT